MYQDGNLSKVSEQSKLVRIGFSAVTLMFSVVLLLLASGPLISLLGMVIGGLSLLVIPIQNKYSFAHMVATLYCVAAAGLLALLCWQKVSSSFSLDFAIFGGLAALYTVKVVLLVKIVVSA